jgi:hypothetical protein
MDILEQFIHSIAYKFPKGYPDVNNSQDMLLLENELKKIGIDLNELINTNHYDERKQERGDVIDIINITKKMLGDKYQTEDIKPEIISNIEGELNKRLSYLEALNSIPISFTKIVAYKVLKPILSVNGNKHELLLKTTYSSDGMSKSNEGTFYLTVVINNKLITLLLLESKSDSDIEFQLLKHLERENLPIKPVVILGFNDFEYVISLDKPSSETKLIDPSTLPYSIRTDYRKGANFEHDDYGKGVIVNTSTGAGGKGDSQGKLDWVEVDFGKPYVSKGDLKKTRIIPNIYTSVSPSIANEPTNDQ